MTLSEYLASTNVSQMEFHRRTGIPQTTISCIVNGGGTHASTALTIIKQTAGLVSLEELVGDNRKNG